MNKLIERLNDLNIQIDVVGDNLDIVAPKGVMTNELIADIKRYKQNLIEIVRIRKENTDFNIPRVQFQNDYPLSSAQMRLWLQCQLDQATSYNMPTILEIKGELDAKKLENAFLTLIVRHESLRTNFRKNKKGKVRQFITPAEETKFKLRVKHLENGDKWEETLSKLISTELNYEFDLEEDSLLRVLLLGLDKDEYRLCFVMHHIVGDGWSSRIIIQELFQLYCAYPDGNGMSLQPLDIQYKDYASWQHEQLKSGDFNESKEYWLDTFKNPNPVLDLPSSLIRPRMKTSNGHFFRVQLPNHVWNAFEKICQSQKATIFTGLLALIKILLYRYTGIDDITIGSPVAGRNHKDTHGQIGFYVNMLPIRSQLEDNSDFIETLKREKESVTKVFLHQEFPYNKLIELLDIERDAGRNPLFDIVLSYETVEGEFYLPNKELEIRESLIGWKTIGSKYDMEFNFRKETEGIFLNFIYNCDVYDSNSAYRMLKHLKGLLEYITEYPSAKIIDLEYLTCDERVQLLQDFAPALNQYPVDETIVSLFEKQVEKTPDKTALVFKNEYWTYTELNNCANQLSHYLSSTYNVHCEDLIGVSLNRSNWIIISILAVLKSGAAYVPIDPNYPKDRIRYIENDSKCKICITDNELEKFIKSKENYSIDNPFQIANPQNLAYIIYTSGSTGLPKGVMIEHRNLVQLLMGNPTLFDFDEHDCWTMFHSYCFDFSVWEVFGAILFGGKLVIPTTDQVKNPALYAKILVKEEVTVLNQTPSAYYNLQKFIQDKSIKIRKVIFGGEALTPNKLTQLNNVKFINMYGITETTIHVTHYELKEDDFQKRNSVIGKAIPTLNCLILDKNKKLLPTGSIGEIYVSGHGLARGYLYKEQLTNDRFIAHPFRGNQRLYKTGDLGKWLPDGNIEYMGRNDDQLKIRGYRIEAGEIENKLKEYFLIEDAVVLSKGERGAKYLVAYTVTHDKGIKSQSIYIFLQNFLPEYMIPRIYVIIDKIPITSNGKIDKKKLLALEESKRSTNEEFVAPINLTEQKLARIWEYVLKCEKVSRFDNYFRLGGDSIRGITLVTKINQKFGSCISIRNLYENPVLCNLATVLLKDSGSTINLDVGYVYLEKIKQDTTYIDLVNDDTVEDFYPISHTSLGMLYNYNVSLENEENDNRVYHDQFVIPIQFDKFNKVVFENALTIMTNRHEVLRTYYELNQYNVELQVVKKEYYPSVSITDIAEIKDKNAYFEEKLSEYRKRGFDFSLPLWKLDLFKVNDTEYLIVLNIHHAITDGWSISIFNTELSAVYNSLINEERLNLPALSLRQRDYIAEQIALSQNKQFKEYWCEKITGSQRIRFAKDSKNQSLVLLKTFNGEFEENFSNTCDQLAIDAKTLSFGLFAISLWIFRDANNFLISCITHGRPIKEGGDKLFGCFLNTVPFKVTCDRYQTLEEYLIATQKTLGEYQSFGRISLSHIKEMTKEVRGDISFVSDVMFNYIDFHNYDNLVNYNSISEEISVKGYEKTESSFLINFAAKNGHERSAGCSVSLYYNSGFIHPEIANGIFNTYLFLLEQVVSSDLAKMELKNVYSSTFEIHSRGLSSFNNTSVAYPKEKTIVDLIEEQVKKTPDRTALVYDKIHLTYKELNGRANQLARYLRKKGVRKGSFVNICLNRSEYLEIALIAVLKSGAAYVLIDTNLPKERREFIISDSQGSLLINDDWIQTHKLEFSEHTTNNLIDRSDPSNLAYLMYTSGSTGKPKGAMNTIEGFTNLIRWYVEDLGIHENDRIGIISNLSFDATQKNYFAPLISGATVFIAEDFDPVTTNQFFAKNKITHVNCAPSMFYALLDNDKSKLKSLKKLMFGGESMNLSLLKQHFDGNNIKIYNLYGPSEASDVTTSYQLKFDETEIIPIGKPIRNVTNHVLNEDLEDVPIGVVGEICIGGIGVGLGYWNKPELNDQKFVDTDKFGRIYCTGDIGRYDKTGNIEFLGRKDHQVKIRGNRVELEEVEHKIMACSNSIINAVTSVQKLNDSEVLIAYIQVDRLVDKSDIRNQLSDSLPSYMVPNYIVELEQLPLTPNGKIDRKNLPAVKEKDLIRKDYTAPDSLLEKTLVDIWQNILGLNKIGVSDDFFELGGNSLMIAQIINRINRRLGLVAGYKQFFNFPTIKGLCSVLDKQNYVSIPKTDEAHTFPLSEAQQRIWILCQQEDASISYNIPIAVKIKGILNVSLFEQSFRKIIQRHEILRTNFIINEEDMVRQIIMPDETSDFSLIERMVKPGDDEQQLIHDFNNEINHTAFSLEKDLLIRGGILHLENKKEHILFFALHHLVGDGWSVELIISELITIYDSLVKDNELKLPQLPIQYKDYAAWSLKNKQEKKYQEAEKYWLEQFKGELPLLALPALNKRPNIKTYNGATINKAFSKTFFNKIKAFSKETKVTLFMTLMAGINSLLHRYSNQDDIIIGTPIAGREHPDLERQIGLYLNTLSIRTRFTKDPSFTEFVKSQGATLLEAYEYQDYPFDKLVGQLSLARDASRSALFDVMIVFQNQMQLKNITTDKSLEQLQITNYELDSKTSNFDLVFSFREMESLELSITYNTDIYDEFFIHKIFNHFEHFMTEAIRQKDKKISQLNYLTVSEQQELLKTFNNTIFDFSSKQLLIDLFEEQVEKTPENIAIVFDSTEFSYKELNQEANQFASFLQDTFAVKSGDRIGVKLEKSYASIVVILGILKLGASYVPIDVNYPAKRIAFIEKHSDCKLLVDEKKWRVFFETKSIYPTSPLEQTFEENPLVYIIYTSGTTGNPKGVMVENEGVVNMIQSQIKQFDISERDRVVWFASQAFDASVSEIFTALISGGSLVIPGSFLTKDKDQFLEFIKTTKSSVVTFPPSYLNLLNKKEVSGLRCIITAGEASLPLQRLKKIVPENVNLFNAYGPTECSVCTTIHKVDIELENMNKIPIGKPINGLRVFILDKQLNLVSVGVTGKLFVSGVGLAKGYFRNHDLTQAKFVTNPFEEGEMMYDTGDYARWLPNGTIDFIGRIDNQVKIRGYRVELEEISDAIYQIMPEIEHVVPITVSNDNSTSIAVYLKSSLPIEKNTLREQLIQLLPSHIIPTYFVELEKLPLTPNGKIDKLALPKVSENDLVRSQYIAPQNQLQKDLASIWEEVLGVTPIGIEDNFFELGGNSLIATQIMSRTQKLLNKSVSYKDFFLNPSIKSVGTKLTAKTSWSIPKASSNAFYPLSHSQKRLWVLSQFENGSKSYNIILGTRMNGNLNVSALNQAFKETIARHEIFRTYFKIENEEIQQAVVTPDLLDNHIEIKSFKLENDIEQSVQVYATELINTVFDLGSPSLLRASLIQVKEDVHLFFIYLHHIIGDGWSIKLLLKEITLHYNALQRKEKANLPPLSIQYKDYAVWSLKRTEEDQYQISEKYWLARFEGTLPLLNLPTFKPRPVIKTYNGGTIQHSFSKSFLDKLNAFSNKNKASLFMTLMTGVNALLYRYTDQNDIIIGVPIAGRNHPDMEGLMGMFVNTLAIRTRIRKNMSFYELLEQEQNRILEAYEHQEYPFDKLVEKLPLVKDTGRNALFDVMVTLQNQDNLKSLDDNIKMDGLETSDLEVPQNKAKFDLSFTFMESEELDLILTYNTDIYDEFLIKRMSSHLEKLLLAFIRDAQLSIGQVDYLSKYERNWLSSLNDNQAYYSCEKTVLDLIEEQVLKTPDNIAVSFQSNRLSYQELQEQSNQLAFYLKSNYGITKGDFISICLFPSEQVLVALLGVLKSGATYIIVDPSLPEERKKYIIRNADSKVVIDDVWMREDEKSIAQCPVNTLENLPASDDVIYLMYTSGSTGNPKGAINTHRGFANLVRWYSEHANIQEDANVGIISNLSFDLTQKNFFAPLTTGGKVVFNEYFEPLATRTFIDEQKITHLNCAPSMFYAILEGEDSSILMSLKRVMLGGESIDVNRIRDFAKNSNARFYNSYGPSEASDVSTCYELTFEEDRQLIPIGNSIHNVNNYILDSNLKQVPIGVVGEICIGGIGVGLGYHNEAKKTAEKFIETAEYGRIYRTGDMGRHNVNGTVEFLGRFDNQVKIRGHRIELGEVETKMSDFDENIKQVVVGVRKINDADTLVAYIESAAFIDKSKLKTWLQRSLPTYMIPTYFVELEKLPLTPNGKIDRKMLPAPIEGHQVKQQYLAPRDEIEHQLVELWKAILKVERIGANDEFYPLGGDSISFLRMLVKVNKQFAVKIDVGTIHLNISIEQLSDRVKELLKNKEESEHFEKIHWHAEQLDAVKLKIKTLYNERLNHRLNLPELNRFRGSCYQQQYFRKNSRLSWFIISEQWGSGDVSYMEIIDDFFASHRIFNCDLSNQDEKVVIIEKRVESYKDIPSIEISDNQFFGGNQELVDFIIGDLLDGNAKAIRVPFFPILFKLSSGQIYFCFFMNHMFIDGPSVNVISSWFTEKRRGEEIHAPQYMEYLSIVQNLYSPAKALEIDNNEMYSKFIKEVESHKIQQKEVITSPTLIEVNGFDDQHDIYLYAHYISIKILSLVFGTTTLSYKYTDQNRNLEGVDFNATVGECRDGYGIVFYDDWSMEELRDNLRHNVELARTNNYHFVQFMEEGNDYALAISNCPITYNFIGIRNSRTFSQYGNGNLKARNNKKIRIYAEYLIEEKTLLIAYMNGIPEDKMREVDQLILSIGPNK